MVKFNKGDKVVMLANWDDKGGYMARNLVIQSWGAVQGTATYERNGQFVKDRIYIDQVNNAPYRPFYFLQGTVDVEAKALELARNRINWQLESWEQQAARTDIDERAVAHAKKIADEYRAMVPSFVGFK